MNKLRGVKFGDFHTANDWALIQNARVDNPPQPKTVYTSIEGRDGDLDQSEAIANEVRFSNGLMSYTYLLLNGSYEDREALINEIMTTVHGKRLQIIEDDNPDVYIVGRCIVTSRSNNMAYGSITIEVNREPYKMSVLETVRTVVLSESATAISLVNKGRKTLIPTLAVSESATINYGNNTVTLGAGDHIVDNLLLKTGATPVTVSGSGTLAFIYREGVL